MNKPRKLIENYLHNLCTEMTDARVLLSNVIMFYC